MPAATPVKTPVAETVTIAVLLLTQIPPLDDSSGETAPRHSCRLPPIAAGLGRTVTMRVLAHPFDVV